SAAVMARIRRHNLTLPIMGLGGCLFIAGMTMSRGGSRGGPGATFTGIGVGFFALGLVYGVVSTIVNLRCPSCKTSLGSVVSSLYAPIGVADDYSPTCRGCGAVLLPA